MFWVVGHVSSHPDVTSLTAKGNYGPSSLVAEIGERAGWTNLFHHCNKFA